MELHDRISDADRIFLNAKIRAHDGHKEMGKAHRVLRSHLYLAAGAWALTVGIALFVGSPIAVAFAMVIAGGLTSMLIDAAYSAEAQCFTAGYLEGQFREVKLLNGAMHRALHCEGERGNKTE